MSQRRSEMAWIVGERLALLAMILNAFAVLLPNHMALAQNEVLTNSGIPIEALERAGLTREQADGLVIPCDGFALRIGDLDGSGPMTLPVSTSGHGCDICMTISAAATAPPQHTATPMLSTANVASIQPPDAVPDTFMGYAPSNRGPPQVRI